MIHEPNSNTLWVTFLYHSEKPNQMHIYPHACVYKNEPCTGMKAFNKNNLFESNNLAVPVGYLGSMASIGDRYILSVIRSHGKKEGSTIALLSLNDPESIDSGVNLKIIDKLPGEDVYTYTDYTGNALYRSTTQNEVDFTKQKKWDATKPIERMSLIFDADTEAKINWKNIRFEMRCYRQNSKRPPFEVLDIRASTLEQVNIMPVKTCIDKQVDHAEIKLESLNNTNDLCLIRKFQLTAFQ
jgi:hypothetical protein